MDWTLIVSIPITIGLLFALYPVFDTLFDTLFTTLDSTTNIAYTGIIKVIVGFVGLALGFGVIFQLIRGMRAQPRTFEPFSEF